MRADPVLVVASALFMGGWFSAAPVAVGTAVVAVTLLLARRTSFRTLALAGVFFAVSALRARASVAGFELSLERARVALGAPRRCSGVARVVASPTVRAGALSFIADFESLDCEGRTVPGLRARLYGSPVDLNRGDRVSVVAQLAPAELFRNSELADPTPSAARTGVTASGAALDVEVLEQGRSLFSWIDRFRARVRKRIDGSFAPEAAPMARALVLGENDLSDEDNAAFRASGLAHLLAVSGTHLVVAVLGIVRALTFLLVRVERIAARFDAGRLAAAFGVVFALVYADFAGGSGSAWRAAWMLAVALGARALGRRPAAVRSFALSLGVGASLDPLVAFDVSFVLSVLATAGLFVLGRPIASALRARKVGRVGSAVCLSFVATVSATVPCSPVLAILGPRLTIAGLFANVVAVPFGEALSLPLCLAHAIACFSPLERGLGRVASGALLVVRQIARVSAGATWLAVPVPPPGVWHFVIFGVGAVGACLAREIASVDRALGRARTPPSVSSLAVQRAASVRVAWLVATVAALVAVEIASVRAGRPRGELRVTVLDVGQGDSTFVDLPDGELMIIDGGGLVGSPVDPGAAVLAPLLRARRRTRVDIAVLSHPHPDHYIGLRSALRGVDVGELWDTGQGRAQGAGPEYQALLADMAARHVPVRGPDSLCGPERKLGGALVSVDAPCPSFDPGRGPNDNSFVIRVRYGGRAALFMGDAERDEEAELLRTHPGDLRADLLKAGHHGSRTSTSKELLDRVQPEISTISCGVRNRFGHPHAVTLETLLRAGVAAFRTDRRGSIEWRTNGGAEALRVFEPGSATGDRAEGGESALEGAL